MHTCELYSFIDLLSKLHIYTHAVTQPTVVQLNRIKVKSDYLS